MADSKVDKMLAALDRLDQQAREDARRNSEPLEPPTTERVLVDGLRTAQSTWFTIPAGRPSS
jgi:hypothetical protein